ncbi:site-2 protease family protein [Mycobacterium koreense]|uniref:Zinc metalloprotease Rip1 n=1 Tax=Mycolicibacillus koreensis TaxID=1069220 RepID=A0A7I7SCI0_9MYCO|nr:M50 family metallopeptidase [Mycolicibacillus koreensis]MCV7247980.1 site-2 protease family protein [Mycolicibacillus koreensis]ODR07357.1 zinc metalloprotease [Mycolicibacillus koreensis]OSC33187.1 zinc metalloprotease [Mycolicibacillus koreensis]BBY54413.1 zinc metalloprotease [Mycolicibacillus koreensis]
MMFVVGIVLFAVAILVSVALHECGHMWVARATGMKVRRYFVGFGPTLWSTRRGETEYGLKAVPAGGFCDIAGMTAIEELEPDEADRAMYKQATWKRVAVLFAGPGMNFVIGVVLVYAIAVIWGLPNLHPPTTAVVGDTGCIPAEVSPGELEQCTGTGPAAAAGIQAGDVVTQVGDTPVSSFAEMAAAVRASHGTVPVVVQRDGQSVTAYVQVTPTTRWIADGDGEPAPTEVGAIGVSAAQYGPTHYNVATAIPATVAFTGDLGIELGKALIAIPTKVGALLHAIGGGERDLDTPISVVGASLIGGETVDHGLWMAFWFFLAQLNFVLGVINLVPLLPFDGGHIAIAVYEKIRNMIRSARGVMAADPVDYLKLMPATYVILVLVVGYMLLTVTADVVSPIKLFQ